MADENQEQRLPPLQALAALYESAPEELLPFLDRAVGEMMATTIPRIAALTTFGSLMSNDELQRYEFGEQFSEAVEEAEAAGINISDALTPTDREIGREIGQLIDQMIQRSLITNTREYVSRDAHMEITAGHALLVRGIAALKDVPDGLEHMLADVGEV